MTDFTQPFEPLDVVVYIEPLKFRNMTGLGGSVWPGLASPTLDRFGGGGGRERSEKDSISSACARSSEARSEARSEATS